jgi:hypothetical protein
MQRFFSWMADDLHGLQYFLRWLICLLLIGPVLGLAWFAYLHHLIVVPYLLMLWVAVGWRRR